MQKKYNVLYNFIFFVVTIDGERTLVNSNIIHPDNIEEKNLLVKGLQYMENGKIYYVRPSMTR